MIIIHDKKYNMLDLYNKIMHDKIYNIFGAYTIKKIMIYDIKYACLEGMSAKISGLLSRAT